MKNKQSSSKNIINVSSPTALTELSLIISQLFKQNQSI